MAAAKKTGGLGKGLDALFGNVEVPLPGSADRQDNQEAKKLNIKTESEGLKVNEGTIRMEESGKKNQAGDIAYIDINQIKPNSKQPRKVFDEEKLEELATSIKEHGLIQPVVLRKSENGYEIVAGERRWRACRLIGIKEIPCIVKELSDEENMLLAIIENMQREDLNPIEEAEGLKQMIDTYGLTQEEVSRSIGKSRPYIANSLRLLRLPEKIIKHLSEGELSAGHAKALAGVEDEIMQLHFAEEIIKKGLSVRQLEKMIREGKPKKRTTVAKGKSADVKKVEDDLKNILGTKVNLNQNQRGNKGKIEIEFYSKEELERLIELLKTLD